MATTTEVFRLTRRNAHQLPDMRTIVHQQSLRPSPILTSLELPVLRRVSPSSSAARVEWSRSRPAIRRSPLPTSQSHSSLDGGHQSRLGYRLTRTMSESARPTRSYFSSSNYGSPSSAGASATRHHSLVAMRTYYAFGARSMQGLDRGVEHSSNVSLSTYGMYGTSSSSLSGSAHDTYTRTPLRRPYQSSISPASRYVATSSYSSPSAYDRYCSTKSKSSGYSTLSSTYLPLSSTYSSVSSTYSPASSTYSPLPSTYSPSSAIASSSSPSSYRSSTYHRTSTAPYSGSTATSFQSAAPSRQHVKPPESPRPTSYTPTSHDTKMPPTRSAMPQIVEHVSISDGKDDSNVSNAGSKRTEAEWQSLSDRNKALEKEVEELKKQLREKERLETELKRRLFESEAEAKVWQNKYEKLENEGPKIVHIREPGDEGGISEELVGKLDSATDKLAKLDALREMALLQTEMEDALKQITEKPV
uniref:Uncharacterized protein n=1 Tax=Plectus sambesii TaxID=2011161 RepID=A0A914W9U2_9BILA